MFGDGHLLTELPNCPDSVSTPERWVRALHLLKGQARREGSEPRLNLRCALLTGSQQVVSMV